MRTDDLSADEIQQLILKRQKASGYQLWFEADEQTLKSRSYQKLMDNDEQAKEYLQQRYFEKLARMAEGNATVAMVLWIRSIKEFDDTFFTIYPFNFSATEQLEGLDNEDLFVLSAFIRHDALKPAELAVILECTQNEAEMAISRLYSRGILLLEDDQYELNDLIYRQVVRMLKTRNILH
jgi:hypothetical protein